ncbi:hypothetical protein AB1286_33115 [Trinickia sp. NRRL B-1857]|uniref:hypothetical protein n=1 Tax=Trinickia sp. NRRL B-1857 TaxID=3162879 RepID=UPI003D2951CC
MKERPIPFNVEMALAVVEGRKTQTRRVVRGTALEWLQPGVFTPEFVAKPENGLSPYGYAGDRLWGREPWRVSQKWNGTAPRDLPVRTMTVMYEAGGHACNDDNDWAVFDDISVDAPWIGKYRPAMFMPRWASRITLEVTGVRIERLQAIDWEDAIAEGIRDPRRAAWRVDPVEGCVAKYRELWDSLNAARGHGWDANPFVWVVEFKRIKQ